MKNDRNENVVSPEENDTIAEVDKLFKNATDATDSGDYKQALENLGDILKHVGGVFGDNDELDDLKTKLEEVSKLLEETE